jgi:hypothetical protein
MSKTTFSALDLFGADTIEIAAGKKSGTPVSAALAVDEIPLASIRGLLAYGLARWVNDRVNSARKRAETEAAKLSKSGRADEAASLLASWAWSGDALREEFDSRIRDIQEGRVAVSRRGGASVPPPALRALVGFLAMLAPDAKGGESAREKAVRAAWTGDFTATLDALADAAQSQGTPADRVKLVKDHTAQMYEMEVSFLSGVSTPLPSSMDR